MSQQITDAIAAFEARKSDLAVQIARIDAAINAMRSCLDTPADDSPRVERRTPAPPTAKRELRGKVDAIKDALKAGPLAPRELAERVGLQKVSLRPIIADLVARGVLRATGTTNSRRIELAGNRPKEAP
jgi:hypothetical protein